MAYSVHVGLPDKRAIDCQSVKKRSLGEVIGEVNSAVQMNYADHVI